MDELNLALLASRKSHILYVGVRKRADGDLKSHVFLAASRTTVDRKAHSSGTHGGQSI